VRLRHFRATNYRSINDSGEIEVRDRTALVGRNESGKSNLLLALQATKPPGGLKPLSKVKDFPRDRRLSDFSDDLPVAETLWELDAYEQSELGRIFPRAAKVTNVAVTRMYKAGPYMVRFQDLSILAVPAAELRRDVAKVRQSLTASAQAKDPAVTMTVAQAVENLAKAVDTSNQVPTVWARQVLTAAESLRQAAKAASIEMTDLAQTHLANIERLANQITNDDDAYKAARNWVVQQLPVFIYLSDYPELDGHQSLTKLANDQAASTLDEAERNFLKLMNVAGLDPNELQELVTKDHEERQQLANRAGAVVTKKIRELWSDRQLKVRFNIDAEHFDTLISDPNAYYDVEVNFNERSRGFRWFFSFYITFAADTASGAAKQAILLLDEPGLHLHAVAQRDLLEHFKLDFADNQIIYTTHSPFMIPVDDLSAVRTVNIDTEKGTTVTNDPTGDAKTLFPLQSALGYDLTQTLFVGERTLVVEGVTDYWYLSAVSERLAETGGVALPPAVVITPAGGAKKVPYMVALLTSQRLRVLVLLDHEPTGREAATELRNTGLARPDAVLHVGEVFLAPQPSEADIEDLLDPAVYDQLVVETYATELQGNTLTLNPRIPRIVKRYEDAFRAFGHEFHKTRPARLFLRRIAEDPNKALTTASRERFERLFGLIDQRFSAQARRDQQPFR
jgi:predicted ATP-dependent endonuclease of OLD family